MQVLQPGLRSPGPWHGRLRRLGVPSESDESDDLSEPGLEVEHATDVDASPICTCSLSS